jgi:hypothetical protein
VASVKDWNDSRRLTIHPLLSSITYGIWHLALARWGIAGMAKASLSLVSAAVYGAVTEEGDTAPLIRPKILALLCISLQNKRCV